MTYDPNETLKTAAGLGSGLRVEPRTIKPKTFASGTALLPLLTPVAFNNSVNHWVLWSSGVSEITTLTAHAATPASAGAFTLTVDGETTAAIAFNATAAAVQAALEALSNIKPGDVSAVATTGLNLGVASAVVTISWQGDFAGVVVAVSADQADISAGSDFVLAEAQAGVEGNDTDVIRGFVWSDAIQLVDGVEVLGNVLLEGKVHAADIPVPAGETTGTLYPALRSGLRERGIMIEGIGQVR